jgi:hypothetical protein
MPGPAAHNLPPSILVRTVDYSLSTTYWFWKLTGLGGGRRRREGRRRRRRPLPSNVKEIRGNCASPAAPAGWRTLTRSQSTWTTTTTTTHRRTLCECRVLCKKKQKKQLKKKLKIRWWKKKNDGRSWAKRKEKKRTNDVKSLCVLHESNNLPPKSDGIAKDLR